MQTKLTKNEKLELLDMREMLPNVVVTHNENVTVAFRTEGKNVRFATAIAAPTEYKYRHKVGEYLARQRLDFGQSVILPAVAFEGLQIDMGM